MRTMRTVGLILMTCVVTCILILVGLVLWLGLAGGVIVGTGVVVATVGAYWTLVAPWHRRWGASDEEVRMTMPCDDLLRSDAGSTTRAITIDAPPEEVFPWLLQIGFGRGGWYSYDWIDNDGRPSIDRISPELQRLGVGDRIEMVPRMGPVVREIVPNEHILSAGDTDSWCLLVARVPGGARLISRWRQDWPRTIGTRAWMAIVDPGAFIMERKMLLNIRDLASRRSSVSRSGASEARRLASAG